MSEKIIKINPELFNLSKKNTTRKTKPSNSTPNIKVRTPKEKTKTLRKNHILRFIRDQQEKNFNKMLETDSSTSPINTTDTDFNSDFDESLKYLLSLTEEQKQATELRNRTLRHHPKMKSLNEEVSVVMPNVFQQNLSEFVPTAEPTAPLQLASPLRFPQPLHGCMKTGGTLPTYRQYHNVTQRRLPSMMQIQSPMVQNQSPMMQSNNQSPMMQSMVQNQSPMSQMQNAASMKMNEIKQTMKFKQSLSENSNPTLKYQKQRRTIRRTHNVGKSKTYPKIGVLVSNKTLRNNITTKSQLLKQISIPEIKRYLIKKGFIKVGSAAPNDVLRKMYETSELICGEIQNHNPDNLLYNYFNDVVA